MAKLQIDGIEIAEIDAARAVRVLRLVREKGPGTMVHGPAQQSSVEVVLPLAFAPQSSSAAAVRWPRV